MLLFNIIVYYKINYFNESWLYILKVKISNFLRILAILITIRIESSELLYLLMRFMSFKKAAGYKLAVLIKLAHILKNFFMIVKTFELLWSINWFLWYMNYFKIYVLIISFFEFDLWRTFFWNNKSFKLTTEEVVPNWLLFNAWVLFLNL